MKINSIKNKSRINGLYRLFFLLFILTFFQNQQTAAQSVSLSGTRLTLRTAFTEIEQQTRMSVDYNRDVIDVNRTVTLPTKSGSLSDLMPALLQGTGCTYTIRENHIVISRSTVTQQGEKRTITGTVTDERGEPVIGANVVEKGTTNGVITDIDGNFSLSISDNATLQVSYIGFINQEIQVRNQSSIQIILREDTQALEEVVVVGYGTQKKTNLTGAVSSVSVDDIAKRQVGQTSLALQGLIPGVSITQQSGQPGVDNGIISIRGKTTLGNNEALILVDGVEMNLNNIDPALIESVSILKDAASAAIYGSRAANGVILITTKRANVDKFQISYNGYVGWQNATNLPNMVDAVDHMKLINTAYTNTGRSPLYSDEFIHDYQTGMTSNPDKYPNTDWINQTITNSGLMQNHFLTLSGGSKQIRTLATFGYFDQEGILPNTNYKRYSFRINTDMEFNKMLSAKIDANYLSSKQVSPSRDNAFHWMSRIPANQAGVYRNGQWGEGWNGDNPIAFTNDGGLQTVDRPAATLNFVVNFDPVDWLNFQAQYSPHYYEVHNINFKKKIQTYSHEGEPAFSSPQISSLNDQTDRNIKNLLTFTGTFNKTIGAAHTIKVLAGYQQESFKNQGHRGYRENFTFPEYPVLNAGGEENQKAYGWASEWSLQSLFSRLNYDYKGKYLIETNVRYDGSSRFGKGYKWGLFPSFSAGWRISEESFWESLRSVVDNFKIRGSWGQLGNQNIGDNYPFSSNVTLGGKYPFDKTVSSGASITSLANRIITWETTTVTDIGLDFTLWNKLNITADYYYKVTDDILLQLDVPLTIGMDAPQQNAGKVENKGWEIGVQYADRIGEFNYRVAANLSDVRNKILDLKGIDETGLTVNREGEEMYSLYGLVADGYITPEDYDSNGKYMGATQYGNFAPGDIKYVDQNGDGIINTSDQVIMGTTIPRLTFGVSLYGEYKGFDLNLLFQGVGKANGYIFEHGVIPFYMGGTAQEMHKDYWTNENRNAAFPRLAFNEVNNNQNSSFWIRDASYVRLKNVQLGYSLPKRILEKCFVSQLRIYFSGDNLITLDNFWDSYDVEAPIGNGGFYPHMKTISFGIDLKF